MGDTSSQPKRHFQGFLNKKKEYDIPFAIAFFFLITLLPLILLNNLYLIKRL